MRNQSSGETGALLVKNILDTVTCNRNIFCPDPSPDSVMRAGQEGHTQARNKLYRKGPGNSGRREGSGGTSLQPFHI